MLNFDKIKQAGSLMKQMNNLKKNIDQLESVAETNDGSLRVIVKGTSSIKAIEIDSSLLNENSKNNLVTIRKMTILDAIVIFVFVTFTACSASESDKVKIALDWYPNANHIGIYIAEFKGYFSDENLEVEIYTPSDPSTVLQTVASGSDDFGINYQPDVLIARDEGVPVISVLGMVCLLYTSPSPRDRG